MGKLLTKICASQVQVIQLPRKKKLGGKSTIIVFDSNKGGSGKSTNAVNSSIALANQGKNVLQIDGDIGANCGDKFYKIDYTAIAAAPLKIFDYVMNIKYYEPEEYAALTEVQKKEYEAQKIKILEKLAIPTKEGPYFMAGISTNEEWEKIVAAFDNDTAKATKVVNERILEVLEYYFDKFKYIVIDTSQDAKFNIQQILSRAQKIFIIVNNAPGSRDNNMIYLKELILHKKYPVDPRKVAVIANDVDPQTAKDIRDEFKRLSDTAFKYKELLTAQICSNEAIKKYPIYYTNELVEKIGGINYAVRNLKGWKIGFYKGDLKKPVKIVKIENEEDEEVLKKKLLNKGIKGFSEEKIAELFQLEARYGRDSERPEIVKLRAEVESINLMVGRVLQSQIINRIINYLLKKTVPERFFELFGF